MVKFCIPQLKRNRALVLTVVFFAFVVIVMCLEMHKRALFLCIMIVKTVSWKVGHGVTQKTVAMFDLEGRNTGRNLHNVANNLNICSIFALMCVES